MKFAIDVPVYRAKYSWYDTNYEEDYVGMYEYVSRDGENYRIREIISTFTFKTPDICTKELCYLTDYILGGFIRTYVSDDTNDDILIENWNNIRHTIKIIMALNKIEIIGDIKSIIIKFATELVHPKLILK